MRQCAAAAARAVSAGHLDALAAAMSANTDAQRRLHADLVCADAERVVNIARAHGVAGWKVNGAGGDGGSLTLLAGRGDNAAQALADAVRAANDRFRVLPTTLDEDGLRVSVTTDDAG